MTAILDGQIGGDLQTRHGDVACDSIPSQGSNPCAEQFAKDEDKHQSFGSREALIATKGSLFAGRCSKDRP